MNSYATDDPAWKKIYSTRKIGKDTTQYGVKKQIGVEMTVPGKHAKNVCDCLMDFATNERKLSEHIGRSDLEVLVSEGNLDDDLRLRLGRRASG